MRTRARVFGSPPGRPGCPNAAAELNGAALRRITRLVLACLIAACGVPGGESARAASRGDDLGLAVLPFESIAALSHDTDAVASGLASALSESEGVAVLSPGDLPDGLGAMPQARDVRKLAFDHKLEAVVAGLLRSGGEGRDAELEISVLSGHSGATLTTYRRTLDPSWDARGLGRISRELSQVILADLGWHAGGHRAPDVGMAAEPARDESESLPFFDFGVGNPDEPLSIESEEAEFISMGEAGRRILFSRGVRARQGDLTLAADELEALYRGEESQPEQLVAKGHVVVEQGERSARCDRAVYESGEETLTCTGRAELLSQCEVVRGDSMVFDLERDRARVVGAASVIVGRRKEGGGCARMPQ